MASERSFSHLVVVGSSAGGVDALSILVSTLPPTFSAPIVIAQHLDPNRPSHLGDILGRRTSLPVNTVTERERLRAGVIYVVPANRNIIVSDSSIEIDRDGDARPKPSVDLLLSSAAEAYGEQLIAVILSGTGSDGAAGARAVKQAGGTVVIQNPETASYPGMPLSLAPTTVDIVANIERIGPILNDLLGGLPVPTSPDDKQLLEAFLDEVRERFGLDFNSYKRPTVLRRLQRRIIATDTTNLPGYIQYVQAHPDEYQQLINAFLIKVTEFMRDGELYTFVQEQVVPDLVTYAHRHGNELRIWSAGCATGEEAYSLAIIISEALGPALEQYNVRIFATDADANAIDFARRGIYPASALAHMPPDLVAKYFVRDERSYQVRKRVRALTVFGQHDLGQRAPFPHIDMVLCRNVLIYFTSDLQQRALKLFAFSLRDGGYLVLGKAESPGQMTEFFRPVDKLQKVYKREGDRILIPPTRTREPLPAPHRLPIFRRPTSAIELSPGQKELQRARSNTESMMSRLPIGIILVDRRYDIQMINSAARRFLSIHGAAVGEDFVHLAENVPSAQLRAAIDQALRSGEMTAMDEFMAEDVGTSEKHYYYLTCHPQRMERDDGPFEVVMVVVQDVTNFTLERRGVEEQLRETSDELGTARNTAQRDTERREQLIQQLVQSNRQLLEANQELTSANEELRTTNEEFLLSNEEAQAAIEEVETLNEELQATNEELETLNEELQSTIEELNTTYDDLHARSVELRELASTSEEERARLAAMLASMADAVLVVDKSGEPLLTNAAFQRLFGTSGDIPVELDDDGRPLPPAMTPQQRVARGESFSMEFTTTDAGDGERHWYEANGQPVGDSDSGLSGGVLIIRDITERSLHRLQDQFLSLASHELRTPLQAQQTALQMLQKSLGSASNDQQALRAADLALDQTHRMARLVDDLLDAARLQTGKYTFTLDRVRFDELATHVLGTARLLAGDKQITLSGVNEPITVMGDAQRLEQAILNLVNNAVRHASSSNRIELSLRREGSLAVLDVRDYGPGIPASDLPHLFTRFFHVSAGRARETWHGGLGLGLYIAQQIVQAHGGRITVATQLGHGSTFSISLPLVSNKAPKR